MTLQQFIDFDHYVRCFTFGKTDITPVAYDPRERRYLVEHEYLSAEVGARVVRDAQLINLALGYEMNTIEFAVKDGVPYAIDYLNPAPDFERDRITPFYFTPRRRKDGAPGRRSGVERSPRAVLAAMGRDARHRAGIGLYRSPRPALICGCPDMDLIADWHALLRPDEELTPRFTAAFASSMRARKLTFGQRVHCPFLRPFFLTAADEARIRAAAETIAALGERVVRAALESDDIYDQLGMTEAEDALVDIDPGYQTASTTSRLDAFLLSDSLHFAEYNAESPAGIGYTQRLCELFDSTAVMGRFRAKHHVRFHDVIDGAPRRPHRQLHASGAARPSRRRWPSWTGGRCPPGRSSRSCATPSRRAASRRSSAIHGSWCSPTAR